MKKLESADFVQGQILRTPFGEGKGYWVGCPSATFDPTTFTWFITYRLRRPRGVQPDRGGEVRIAKSTDGLKTLQDLQTIPKSIYNSSSIERSHLHRCAATGMWHYFTSYVNPDDNDKWCVTVSTAMSVELIDPSQREVVFTASQLGVEGVKDPFVVYHSPSSTYFMFLSVATANDKTSTESHQTQDIYNTGDCTSVTAVAVSKDGMKTWHYKNVVMAPAAASRGNWDAYCTRMNSVWIAADGMLRGTYDGIPNHEHNYEERCGICVPLTGEGEKTAVEEQLGGKWVSITPEGPIWQSPHHSGALRYVEVVVVDQTAHLFYEFCNEDGSHDLRHLACPLEALP